jgi:hypothetical protein
VTFVLTPWACQTQMVLDISLASNGCHMWKSLMSGLSCLELLAMQLPLRSYRNISKIVVIVGTITYDSKLKEVSTLKMVTIHFIKTTQTHILKLGGEVLMIDQFVFNAPTRLNTTSTKFVENFTLDPISMMHPCSRLNVIFTLLSIKVTLHLIMSLKLIFFSKILNFSVMEHEIM